MEKTLVRSSLALVYFLLSGASFAQIVLNTNYNAQAAVEQVLLGPGINASNVTFNGQPGSTFSTQLCVFNGVNCNIGSPGGLMLATGAVINVFGPNDLSGSTEPCMGPPCGGGDADLLEAAQLSNPNTSSINDAAVLEFDFVPIGDSLKFEFVFASEEYLEYVGSGFNDVFGFFLSGPGISGPYANNAANIALIPNTSDPVTINSVNNLQNSSYYVDNGTGSNAPYNTSPTYVQYDGFTVKLTALAAVTCGQTYHIKIAVGDAGDTALDSAVFLEAGSFASNAVELSSQIDFGGQDSTLYEGCGQATIVLSRADGFSGTETVHLVTQGAATEGIDYSPILDSVTLTPGLDTILISLNALLDNFTEGPELAELIAIVNGPCGADSTFLKFFIDDAPVIDFVMGPGASLACPGDSAFVGATVGGGFGDLSIDWSSGPPDGSMGAWLTPSQTTTYTVTVTDECGVYTHTGSATVIVPQPAPLVVVALPDTLSYCPEPPVQLHASVQGGTLPYTYQWSDGLGSAPQAQVAPPTTDSWTLTVTDACDETVADQVTVTVQYDSVGIIASLDTTICFNDTARLSAISFLGHGDHLVEWSDGATGLVHDAVPPYSLDYTVTVTDACAISASDVVHVEVHHPSADFSYSAAEMMVNFPIQFVDQSSGAVYWHWTFDHEDLESDEQHPSVVYPEEGIYTVILRITDELGCTDSTYRVLLIDPEAQFYLPTSFTPNGDGINETFGAQGIGVESFEMRIYDRWGENIFSTEDMTRHWDGTYGGSPAQDGIYVVWLRWRDVLHVKHEHYGQVMLMR